MDSKKTPKGFQTLSSQALTPRFSTYDPTKKKNPREFDWIHMVTLDEDECFYTMSRGQYKMICTHNGYIWSCTVHPNLDDHKMEVSYYSCKSKNCIQNEFDSCPYRNCVRKCLKENLYYVYKVIIMKI